MNLSNPVLCHGYAVRCAETLFSGYPRAVSTVVVGKRFATAAAAKIALRVCVHLRGLVVSEVPSTIILVPTLPHLQGEESLRSLVFSRS